MMMMRNLKPYEDMDNEILNDIGVENYDSVEKVLNQPEMTQQKKKKKTENILIRLSMRVKEVEMLCFSMIQNSFSTNWN